MRRGFICLSCLLCACGGESTSSSPSPTTPTTTKLDCVAVFDCAKDCGDDADGSCTKACVDRATPEAHDQLVALVECDEAQACEGDEACLESRCAVEVAACRGETTTPDGLPSRYVGTVVQDLTSVGFPIHATGQVVFVRDDASVPTLQAHGFAVYRAHTITYVTSESAEVSGCTLTANETVTLTDPDALNNHFAIRIEATDGQHEYDVSVSNHEKRVGALTRVCQIGGTSHEDFNADINVSRGTGSLLTDDVWHVKATIDSFQTWSWDLRGE